MQALKVIILLTAMIFMQGSTFVIDPAKNAVWHNDRGLFFLRMDNYYGAIQEFKIAISLNRNTQASAAFYYNLGSAYKKIGVIELARPCFQRAVSLNPDYAYLCPDIKNLGNANKHKVKSKIKSPKKKNSKNKKKKKS